MRDRKTLTSSTDIVQKKKKNNIYDIKRLHNHHDFLKTILRQDWMYLMINKFKVLHYYKYVT